MLRLFGIPPAGRALVGVVLLGIGIAVHRVPLMAIGGVVVVLGIVGAVSRGRDRSGTNRR